MHQTKTAARETDATGEGRRPAMLSLDDPDRDVDRRCVTSPGGFAWWYAEVSDGRGNGVVVIWSFGLPFLPQGGGGSQQSRAEPLSRPSVNVAVYRDGAEAMYALHEVAPEQARWEPRRGGAVERWRVGDCSFTARREGAQTELHVELDLPVSGGDRMRGELRLTGRTARWTGERRAADATGGAVAPEMPAHRWTPMVGAAFATARVRCGAERAAVTGRAYHDRNAAPVPLDALGIDTWMWGRASTGDRDRVFYGLWPKGGGEPTVLAYELRSGGEIVERRDMTLAARGGGRTVWGMPTGRQVTLKRPGERAPWLTLAQAHRVDDGPFYTRDLCAVAGGVENQEPNERHDPHVPSPQAARARGLGGRPAEVHGTLEIIRPDRIHLARFRPLVRMRVSHSSRPNSVWLPLFEGDRRTRWQRLWRSWRSPAGARPSNRPRLAHTERPARRA